MQQSEWRSSTCLKNYESLSCNEIHGMFMWKVKKKEGEEYKIEFIIHKKELIRAYDCLPLKYIFARISFKIEGKF